jgi:hypothetical protein
MVFPKEPWWLKELQRCACTLSSEPTPESDQQTSDRPSPAERGTRKPFDRFPGLALSAEALPDCGAVCRLCDMDTSDREHWGALACVWRFAKSFGIGCFKGDPLQAAPEYVVDVNSPCGDRLSWQELFDAPLHFVWFAAAASTAVAGCPWTWPSCSDAHTRRATSHRPAGRPTRQRHARRQQPRRTF